MTSAGEVVQAFIAEFIEAWPSGDASALVERFSAEAVYHNMPLEPVVGRAAIRSTLESFMALGGHVAVDVVHLVVEGDVVLTERVDHLTLGGRTMSLPLMGICEVRDGKIAAWRDYFDLAQWAGALEAAAG